MLARRRHGRTVTVGVVLFVLADECKSNIYFRFQPRKICVLKCSLFDSLRQLVANFVRCLALPKCMLKSRNIADGVLNKSCGKTLKNKKNKKIYLFNFPPKKSCHFFFRAFWLPRSLAGLCDDLLPKDGGLMSQRWRLFTLHLGLKGVVICWVKAFLESRGQGVIGPLHEYEIAASMMLIHTPDKYCQS